MSKKIKQYQPQFKSRYKNADGSPRWVHATNAWYTVFDTIKEAEEAIEYHKAHFHPAYLVGTCEYRIVEREITEWREVLPEK